MPQREGVEAALHLDTEPAGKENGQFAAAARTGNLNRDKPLLCGLFTAPSRLLSEAGQIAGQCLQWQIPLLTEICLTESACFILSRYLIRFRTAPVPAMLLSRCLHDSTSAPKMAAAKMRLLVRLR